MATTFCNDRSVLNHQWKLREPQEENSQDAHNSSTKLLISSELETILKGRGVKDIAKWLEPRLAYLKDPHILNNMEEAISLFCQGIEENKKIGILGDYDVDGATSTAILIRFMRLLDHEKYEYYIPQRLTEGYGPNVMAIEKLHENGVEILIIADSGTMAFAPIERAVELGMKVIVLDHHEPGERLPPAVIVNPKIDLELHKKEEAPYYLCTAGLAFLFICAVRRKLRELSYFEAKGKSQPKIDHLLGLVALGTVADLVPLRDMNRIMVANGLKQLINIPGVKAIVDLYNHEIDIENKEAEKKARANDVMGGRKKPTKDKSFVSYNAYACGFIIGPCLNAVGRLDDCMVATSVLLEDDTEKCNKLAQKLYALNRQRQALQESMVNEGIEKATIMMDNEKQNVIVAYNPDWHPGIIGLVASKLKDYFDLPSIVIGQHGKGSGRSVKGFNLGKALIEATEAGLLLKGGGHAAAAGLTIDESKIDQFRDFLIEKTRDLDQHRVPVNVDLVISPGALQLPHIEEFMSTMEPFGMSNTKPRVVIHRGLVVECRVMANNSMKVVLQGENNLTSHIMLWKNTPEKFKEAFIENEGEVVDVLAVPSINDYGGRKTVQYTLEDVMVPERKQNRLF